MPKRTAEELQTFLKIAKQRYDSVVDKEIEQRKMDLEDLKFESGEHWDEKLIKERKLKRKPTVTINSLAATIRQGSNQQRVSQPGIRVKPASNAANREKAKTYSEIFRQIQRNSKAYLAYDNARQYQRKIGRGYWVVRTAWAQDNSMEQVIRIEWIDNPHSVFLDPNYKKQDYSDRLWGHIIEDYSLDDFKTAFPESTHQYDLSSFGEGQAGDWLTKDRIRVSEYYWIDQDVKIRIQLDNGQEVMAHDLPQKKVREHKKTVEVPVIPEGRSELRRRHIKQAKVFRTLMTAREIFEENEIPCSTIPIIQIDGERRNIPGKGVDLRGQVRDAKEPARVRDFMESGILEAVVISRTAPWLVEMQQIAGLEKEWAGQAVDNPVVLRYKAQGSAENPIPPPKRNIDGPDIGAFVAAASRAQNHERQVLGTPDVFQEETLREQSGRAIQARRSLQEIGTSHFSLNEAIGLERTGEILLEMVPRIYDRPRVMRIVNDQKPGEERDMVLFAGKERAGDAARLAEQHQGAQLFDVSDGRYEVDVSAGRNAETDRVEAVEMITEAIRQHPALAPIALPILFRHSDWVGSEDLADALSKNDQIPPEVKERLEMLDKFAATATQALEDAKKESDKLRMQLSDKTLDRNAKMQIAMAQQATQRFRETLSDETKLAVAEMKELGQGVRDEFNAFQERMSQMMTALTQPPAAKPSETV